MNSNRISIFIAGDFCSRPSTSRIMVSDELRRIIQSCDIKVVNFEVPLKSDMELPPLDRERFYQNEDAPEFLHGLGFNLFSLANNHAFDWGEDGLKKTVSKLNGESLGVGTYDEAYKVKVFEVCGIKVGFLALSFAAYQGVFNSIDNHEGLGCAYINDTRVNHDIIEAKKKVDYLFILPHDGIEYIDIPLPETMVRYRDFIDYGADGVFGAHPHCPQGWELYRGKPIFYSLGNFFFNSKDSYDYKANKPHWYEGICVILTIESGNITFDVLNTLNVDNSNLVVDDDEERKIHNKKICRYLEDETAYHSCLSDVCSQIGKRELAILDRSFHPNSIKQFAKLVLDYLINRVKGRRPSNDYNIQRLLTHDARRNLLLWTLKQ